MKLSEIQAQPSGPTMKLSQVMKPDDPYALEAQGAGMVEKIGRLIKGEREDYPEVPQLITANPFDARTVEGQINIIRKEFPQAKLAGQDKFGNPLITLGTDQKHYINRPGASFRDIDEVKAGAKRAILPVAMSTVMAPAGMLAAVPAVAAAGAGGEALAQADASMQGANEGYSIQQMLKTGVFAGLGEGGGRIIAGLLSKVIPKLTGLFTKKVISESGDLSDEAVQALKNAGIGPEDLSAELKAMLNAEIAGGLTPDQAVTKAAFERVQAKPTTGQLTREFSQQQLEAEGAKSVNPLVGAPIRQRLAETNRAILNTADDVLAQTGGTADDLVAGATAKTALRDKSAGMKSDVSAAYTAAREAKGINTPLPKEARDIFFKDAIPVMDRMGSHLPPEITKRLEQYGAFGKQTRDLTVGDTDDFIQLINQHYNPQNGPQAFALDKLRNAMKEAVNVMGQGSDEAAKLFEQGRKLATARHDEFSQKDIVEAIISKKAKFTDIVPDEQVVKKIVFSGSVDDVFKVKKSLTGAGEKGAEAWNNIRASTFKRLMDSAMNPNVKNEAGDVIFSGARFQTELKKIGDKKLSLLFTPKEMEAIHSIRLVADATTNKVPGAVNTSNTASAMLNDAFKRLPFAGSVSDFFVDLGKRKAIKKALTGTPVTKAVADAVARRQVIPKASVVYGQERARE